MHKRLLLILVLLTAVMALFACGSGENTPPEPAAPAAAAPAGVTFDGKWSVAGNGLETPESAYLDPGTGDVFISLIAGMPAEKDGNGSIARLTAEGSVVSPAWVTGLNAPKGLRSSKGTLWTADIDEIIGIDIAKGQITSRTKVEGAQFLNDVAVGGDGTVYVSDMMGNKIYALKEGKLSVFAEGEDLDYPNGVLVEGDALVVGSWGKPEADFTTKVPGSIYKLDLRTKKKTLITPMPSGNFDGLESDGKGGYIASDYLAGKLLRIAANGNIETLAQFTAGTADIGFDAGRNMVIVPHMNENKIAAYDLATLK
jgi:outer membrane protein assembly factor BamB